MMVVTTANHKIVVIEEPNKTVYSQLTLLNKKLQKKGFVGTVIFDRLISQGLTERFMAGYFDGKQLERNTIKVLESVDREILLQQNKYFSSNANLLTFSMLSRRERKLFLEQ